MRSSPPGHATFCSQVRGNTTSWCGGFGGSDYFRASFWRIPHFSIGNAVVSQLSLVTITT